MSNRNPRLAGGAERITTELERAYFKAYPELDGRVRRARIPPPTERYRPQRWRRTLHALLVIVALLILVWLGPASITI